MTTQNMISATLADDVKNSILQKLTEVRAQLNFLITLDPDQSKGLFKAANGFTPFIEKAYATAKAHPDILPKVLEVEEFAKDHDLIQGLTPIQAQVNELSIALRDTLVAANSDALAQALEVYAAVKQHSDKVPGLAGPLSELSVFFVRPKRTKAAPAKI